MSERERRDQGRQEPGVDSANAPTATPSPASTNSIPRPVAEKSAALAEGVPTAEAQHDRQQEWLTLTKTAAAAGRRRRSGVALLPMASTTTQAASALSVKLAMLNSGCTTGIVRGSRAAGVGRRPVPRPAPAAGRALPRPRTQARRGGCDSGRRRREREAPPPRAEAAAAKAHPLGFRRRAAGDRDDRRDDGRQADEADVGGRLKQTADGSPRLPSGWSATAGTLLCRTSPRYPADPPPRTSTDNRQHKKTPVPKGDAGAFTRIGDWPPFERVGDVRRSSSTSPRSA